MRSVSRALVAAAALAAVPTIASADMISTVYLGTNGGSAGGGVYFDITVGANPIQITGFDVNTTAVAGTLFGFRAFTTAPGVHAAGNEANAGAWTLQTAGTGTAAGTDLHSPVTIGTAFTLSANTLYGLALTLSDPSNPATVTAPHRYTNGTGPGNQHYSDPNVTLDLGSATNVFFSGTPFTPRVWNGTIYYSVVPTPGAISLLGLGGLVATRRRR